MVDLHCHILPGVDDGPPDLHGSLAMARAAVDEGTRTVAATPHINYDHDVAPGGVGAHVAALNESLGREDLPLTVVKGGEVALSRLGDLDDEALSQISLGDGSYMLVESPYSHAVPLLDEQLFELELRGFRPLLAHPERCPHFHADPKRLGRLVDRGVLCSINSGSMRGQFGSTVRRFALRLLGEGLVHDVASDAHDADRRPPGLASGFQLAEPELPGISAQAPWYVEEAPAAILTGSPLPPRPRPPRGRRGRWPKWAGRQG